MQIKQGTKGNLLRKRCTNLQVVVLLLLIIKRKRKKQIGKN